MEFAAGGGVLSFEVCVEEGKIDIYLSCWRLNRRCLLCWLRVSGLFCKACNSCFVCSTFLIKIALFLLRLKYVINKTLKNKDI